MLVYNECKMNRSLLIMRNDNTKMKLIFIHVCNDNTKMNFHLHY